MPRIRCRYIACVFLDDGYCSAASIEVDPDIGCATYSRADDVSADDEWIEEDEIDEWDEIDLEDEDDNWLDNDDY
jgi:hypothetical protein